MRLFVDMVEAPLTVADFDRQSIPDSLASRTSETVPSVLLGNGGGNSPGALDANVRHQI